jgi:stage II sporulation protein D
MPRRTLLLALAALIAAGAALAQPRAQQVSATTFVITGHGNGHGVGMGQYGALGFAQHGATYDEILAHFYPGTTLGPAPVRFVRVLLTQASQLTIASTADFRVRDVRGVHPLEAGSYTFGDDLRVAGEVLRPPLVFLPGPAPLQLGPRYRGSIRVTVAGGTLQAVNVVPVDAYARAVVTVEMSSDWPIEALAAQAVAARSYALSRRTPRSEFDVYSDTRDQMYGGIEAESAAANAAVAKTAGQVLFYDGRVAQTFYSSSSGGRTAAATDAFSGTKVVPYLVSVPDPYDTVSPWHTWGPVTIDASRAARLLGVPGLVSLRPVPATGHARQFIATGSNGETTLGGSTVRFALGLRSTWVRIGVLSLQRTAGAAAPGSRVVLSGLARGTSTPMLQQRAVGASSWQAGPPLSVAADGSFTVGVTPATTSEYRLVAGRVSSAPLRVTVAGTS